jgi:hypothetical protein
MHRPKKVFHLSTAVFALIQKLVKVLARNNWGVHQKTTAL